MDLTQKFLPHSFGVVMARKDVHNTVKGFDETIKAVDDVDYVSRASKISKFGFLKTTPLPTSSRRIEKDGRFTTYSKYILIELHLIFLGPLRAQCFINLEFCFWWCTSMAQRIEVELTAL